MATGEIEFFVVCVCFSYATTHIGDTILESMLSKLKSLVTLIIFLSLLLIFFDSLLHKEVFSEKYGLNPVLIATLFAVAEIFFILGAVMMLKGTGVFKIKVRDLLRFKLEKANFSTRIFTAGFIMNRLSASVPWLYVLGVGWRKLPVTVVGLIVLELLIVAILTLGVFELVKKHDYQTSNAD